MNLITKTWEKSTLGEVCEIIGGNPAPKTMRSLRSGGIPFVTMKDLGSYHFTNNLIEVENRVSDEVAKLNRLKLINKGSILLPRSGSVALNHRAILGLDAYMVSHICALEIKSKNRLFNKYLYYYLVTIDFIKITKKTTGLDAITFQDLSNVIVPIPPLSIQKKIAEILEKADQAKQKRQEANKLTEQFLQSVFIEMFGDPSNNHKGWEIGKIGLVINYSEYGTSKKSNKDSLGYPILGMSNITINGEIDLSRLSYVEISNEEFKKLKLEKGDIIFNRTNSTELIGKTACWDKSIDAVLASYLVKLRLNNKVNSLWFSYLLNTKYYKNLFSSKCKKAVNQSNISPTLLKEFPMYIPPVKLQTKFSHLVEQVKLLNEKQKKSEQELDNLFNSLMQKAFKGDLF